MREKSKNVVWQETRVSRTDREEQRGQRGAVLWFTGLSASGKSTLAILTEERLHRMGYATFILDGDNVRHGLNRDLGFTPGERDENIRRVGEVAKLFVDAGTLVATAFISPYRRERDGVRALMERPDDFIEIFVKCPLEVCEERDPKGLYERARAGEIENFTGIDAPYEEPESPDLVVETHGREPEECVAQILGYLRERGYIDRKNRASGAAATSAGAPGESARSPEADERAGRAARDAAARRAATGR